ncbi:MAG: hypothetical protein QM487_14505 [Candidatus Marithrix sp.]
MVQYTPYLNAKWANTPLQELLPYGLTKQMSFQTWLKQSNFFRPTALKYKVLYKYEIQNTSKYIQVVRK